VVGWVVGLLVGWVVGWLVGWLVGWDVGEALGEGSTLASGEGVREFDAQSQAAAEIARLWLAIDRSVKAIHGVYQSAGAMHRVAA